MTTENKAEISVAAVQMTVKSLDVDTNLATAKQLLEGQLQKGRLDLAVFPEDCITGPIPNHAELTLSEDSAAITFFRELATEHQIYIVCGSFICEEEGKLFNRSLLLDPQGKTILRYDKNNLWHPERSYLEPGKALPVVDTPLGRIGIMNCWDLTNPMICRSLAQKSADIICCPSYWMDEVSGELYNKYPGDAPDATMIDALCQARAIENELLFIYANVCGEAEIELPERTLHLKPVGHSQVTAPIKGTLSKLAHGQNGVAAAHYNFELARNAELEYKFRDDMLSHAKTL